VNIVEQEEEEDPEVYCEPDDDEGHKDDGNETNFVV